jgi:CheY-like chemotaxis protein
VGVVAGDPSLEALPRALALVVDDEPLVRRSIARVLHRLGMDVVAARDGRDALELLERSGIRPRVVLTDLEMPRLGGAALIERLRAIPRLATVPVVVVSSCDEWCADAQVHVAKPFTSDDLVRALRLVGVQEGGAGP